MANDSYNLQGQNGVALAAGETFVGRARMVVFDSDATIAAYQGNVARGDTVYSNATRKAGQILGGMTTGLQLTLGSATLYNVDSGYTVT